MGRINRMTKMTRAAASLVSQAAWKEKGTAARDATVRESRCPSVFRPLARATAPPRRSSSPSCQSCPSCLLQFRQQREL